MSEWPTVSFIMPVLNAAGLLENCLNSIVRQTYPRHRYEILIMDGGSSDRSQEIARGYGATVIEDKVSRHMEDSKSVALSRATGDYIVFVDADNEITHPDYVELAVKALQKFPEAMGVEGYYPPSSRMSSLCAYLTHLLHISDPVLWLMSVKPILVGTDGETEIWTLPTDSLAYPLGANGFVYRRADLLTVKADERFQDVHVAVYLLQTGKRQWLRIRGRGVHHYYVQDLGTFLRKRRRAMVHFLNTRREFKFSWLEKKPRIPGWLACVYGLTFVGPLYHALVGLMRDKDVRWLWHIPTSFVSVLGIVWGYVTHRLRPNEKRLVSSLQPRQTLKS
jgi:glycosyltransferase involved in cell wall biosynthesis